MHNSGRRKFLTKALTGGTAAVVARCLLLSNCVWLPWGLTASASSASASFTSSSPGYPSGTSGSPASSPDDSPYGHKEAFAEREAMYYTRLDRNRVQCDLCFRSCIIQEGRTGFCRVRKNRRGTLYSLVYGKPAGLQIDPIEMEPMYHMIPGHSNFCVYTASCNFRCMHCHNWHISQKGPEEISPESYTPYEIVKMAINRGCRSISHSINEPTVFYEYMYDIVKHAKEEGLLTLFHTNGYLSPNALRDILKFIDGVTVDLKAFTDKFYREVSSASLDPVLKTLKIIKKENVHLEIVNLMIPTLNDDPDDITKMCVWIKDNLGNEVPLHFNRFTPTYKLTNLPSTPVGTLEEAAGIAYESGLKYVYVGNVPGHRYNSTYCPRCDERLIHRTHFSVLSDNLEKGVCKSCGYKIEGIWEKM